jgi:Cys-tRNA(Pro)/Cys-tRNA(Cys) deacylase
MSSPALDHLERNGIDHRVHTYDPDDLDDEMTYGEAVAEAVGVAADRLFKTLVAEVDERPVVAIVPVDGRMSTKALARAAGGKRARLVDPSDAERLTGYVTGGISPFGQRRRLPVFVDGSIQTHETVLVSAGRRGLQVEVAVGDLIAETGATLADLR